MLDDAYHHQCEWRMLLFRVLACSCTFDCVCVEQHLAQWFSGAENRTNQNQPSDGLHINGELIVNMNVNVVERRPGRRRCGRYTTFTRRRIWRMRKTERYIHVAELKISVLRC